jgi:hypothetical protein
MFLNKTNPLLFCDLPYYGRKLNHMKPGTVAPQCNPSYLGGRDGRMVAPDQLRQNMSFLSFLEGSS